MLWRRSRRPDADADKEWGRIVSAIASAREQRQEAVSDVPDVVRAVSQALFEADPIGLNFGTNSDEYEPEAETIVAQLPGTDGSDVVAQLTHACFVEWFDRDLAGAADNYDAVAHEIWEIWQHHLAHLRDN